MLHSTTIPTKKRFSDRIETVTVDFNICLDAGIGGAHHRPLGFRGRHRGALNCQPSIRRECTVKSQSNLIRYLLVPVA